METSMPRNYTIPAGKPNAGKVVQVPTDADPADVPKAFEQFADSLPASSAGTTTSGFVSTSLTTRQTVKGELRAPDFGAWKGSSHVSIHGNNGVNNYGSVVGDPNLQIFAPGGGTVNIGDWGAKNRILLTGLFQVNAGFLQPPVMEVDGPAKTLKIYGSVESTEGPSMFKGSTYFGAKTPGALNQGNSELAVLPGQAQSVRIKGQTVADGWAAAHAVTGGTDVVLTGANHKVATRTKSSRRYKEQVKPVEPSVADAALNLKPCTFVYKDGYLDPEDAAFGKPMFGLIAEEVQSTLGDQAVLHSEDGMVENYHDRAVITSLLALVQRQQGQIDDLITRVQALEAKP